MLGAAQILALTAMLSMAGEFDDNGEDWLQRWLGLEWGAYEDRTQLLAGLDEWRLDLNHASVEELLRLPGIELESALKIVNAITAGGPFADLRDLQLRTGVPDSEAGVWSRWVNFSKPSPKSVWVKLRSAARVGKSAIIDANRYDGDPIGSTERVRVSLPPVQLGMLLDKDRYEPSVADLSRFYGAWRSGSATIIAGDFHIGSLDGVTLATKPMLLNGFDGPAGFSKSRQLLEPGLDGIQNSALRGVAGGIEWNGFDLEAFVSRTDLDGILNDSAQVLRLSDSGLHRTAGERRKKNSVTESARGGAVNWHADICGANLSLGAVQYLAVYDPPLRPEYDARDPFPLIGDEAGASGIGGNLRFQSFVLGGESGWDREGHRAWRVDFGAFKEIPMLRGSNRLNVCIYDFPKDWHSPRGGGLFAGLDNRNRRGGAILLNGGIKIGALKGYRAHYETERRSWRTYTIPIPSSSSKWSGELEFRSPVRGEIQIRYRNHRGYDGIGQSLPPIQFREERLRLRWLNRKTVQPIEISTFYIEGATRDEMPGELSRGLMASVRCSGNLPVAKQSGTGFGYYINMMYFTSSENLAFYAAEAELPDRLASVRLGGTGIRSSVVLILKNGGNRRLGIEAARTIPTGRGQQPLDWEFYLTGSYGWEW